MKFQFSISSIITYFEDYIVSVFIFKVLYPNFIQSNKVMVYKKFEGYFYG